MGEGWERSMHGKLEVVVNEKQKHLDPSRRYNGPLQKRENGRRNSGMMTWQQ
jgi:hypothetical protein